MAEETPVKKTHKEWRKEVKKLRRKKIRQKHAEERNKALAEEEATRLQDPEYQTWLQQQEELEALQLEQDERHHQEQEELWMRRELVAEKQFLEQQRKQEATIAAKEAERLRIQKEFEQIQQQAQQRREERKQREEQAKREHEEMLERIAEYIEFGGPIPRELISNVQSNPNKPLCPFFAKTNACRFGMHCCRNHIRPKLSKILFFPNFFSHIKLEQSKDTEYGCDINLECTDSELNSDYKDFFDDVIEELKKFGEIENFRTCMNSQAHLRGNVLVEFKQERDALGAYMKLQGRYYASRRINVEFSSIVTWKSAICGLSYSNKCPKGRNCNYLHIFRNPGNLYNVSVFRQEDSQRRASQRITRDNSVASWNDGAERSTKRNWRWSESPEPIPNKNTTNGDGRSSESRSRRDKEASSSRSERNLSRDRRSKSKDKSSSTRSRREHGSSSCGHKDRKRSRTRSRSRSHERKHKDKVRERLRSPRSSSKLRDEGHNKKSHKERKRKHKSKRSSS